MVVIAGVMPVKYGVSDSLFVSLVADSLLNTDTCNIGLSINMQDYGV